MSERIKNAKSVQKKTEIAQEFRFIQNIATLKVLGFNSSKYDLPCLLNSILELIDISKIHIIKRGESIFALTFNGFSFRDAMHYCGPMSLKKFASIFKLPISKGIFPYEAFSDIQQLRDSNQWPSYKDFSSSLPTTQKDFTPEINQILNLPLIYGLNNFGEFIDFFALDIVCRPESRNAQFMPDLLPDEIDRLKNQLPMSPKLFFQQKFEYEERIKSGQYSSFLDHLIYYNLLDCQVLTEAMKKFLEIFKICFHVCLFERLSLPAISEAIMWKFYDSNNAQMFSFNEKYGFLNKKIRESLMGGPTIVFHRHAEVHFIFT